MKEAIKTKKILNSNSDDVPSNQNAEGVKFCELGISEEVQNAINKIGFEFATDIQAMAIPTLMKGKDLTGISKTGSGKTAAFVIPIIETITPFSKNIEALILCPTRELAVQIFNEIKKFSEFKRGIKAIALFGGQNIEKQIGYLSNPKNFIVGTPGRIIDLTKRGIIDLSTVKIAVLDEADEMLNMGFRDDIKKILNMTNKERQTVLFSATMSKNIMEITKEFQNDSEVIRSESKSLTVSTIEQYYLDIPSNYNKTDVLCNFLDTNDPELCIIFCNTKRGVEELSQEMQNRNFCICCMHGDMKQYERTRVMNMFREGSAKILIATDVVARGIDVDGIEIVFNYDVPQNEEFYVHRIGRTGRAGKSGKAFTLISGRKQYFALKDIESYIKKRIEKMQLPSSEEIHETKCQKIKKEIKRTIEGGNLDEYRKVLEQVADDGIDMADIASALLKLTRRTLQPKISPPEVKIKRRDSHNEKFKIDLGKKDEVTASHILKAISAKAGIPGSSIGKITLFDKHSFIEVPKELALKLKNTVRSCSIRGLYTKIYIVKETKNS